jgi:hypothetical protein
VVADYGQVNSVLLGRARQLLDEWLPGGVWQGNEYKPTNPKRADAHPDGPFSINAETGAWFDSVADAKGGDLIALYAYIFDLRQGDALKRLAQELGLNGAVHSNGATPARGERRRRDLGSLVATYDYVDLQGQLAYQVLRYERLDEEGHRSKTFLQRRPCRNCRGEDHGVCGDKDCKRGWIWNLDGVEPLLYRLPAIIESASKPRPNGEPRGIAIAEGEKAVDALARNSPTF